MLSGATVVHEHLRTFNGDRETAVEQEAVVFEGRRYTFAELDG